jgi:hypothetical protein
MNISVPSLRGILLAATPAFLLPFAAAQSIPSVPVGSLTAFPTIVQTGTKPTLTWDIQYPAIVKDYVEIVGSSTIRAKEKLDVEVRVLGNGVTVSATGSNTFSWVNAQALLSFNSTSSSIVSASNSTPPSRNNPSSNTGSSFGYSQIFYGTNLNVNPNTVVWSRSNMMPNQTIRFGGRYYYSNAWGSTYTTSNSNTNVRTLVNGDTPPTIIPMYSAPSLEDFIRPYLDSGGKVRIGPMDVIVFMELTHSASQQTDPGYDLQDLVLLVTFRKR